MSSRKDRSRIRTPGTGTVRTWVLAGVLLFGVWLSIAPFALEYDPAGLPLRATVNDAVVGIAVIGLALVGLFLPDR